MLPPSLTMMFAPGTVAYTLIRPTGVEATFAGSDRVTYGGWLLPQSTIDLPDFVDRCEAVSEGGSKIWAQDVPVNVGMQAAKQLAFPARRHLRAAGDDAAAVQCLAAREIPDGDGGLRFIPPS